MEKSIDFISSVTCREGQKKVLVLGDMLELGGSSSEEHEKAGVQASSSGADLVLFAGDEMKSGFEAFKKKKSGCGIKMVSGT